MDSTAIFNGRVFSSPFASRFEYNIDMLDYRLKKLMSIDTFNKDNMQEFQLTFDAAMVLFRSIFLENRKDNYTMQNYFRLTGREDTAEQLDALFNRPFVSYMDKSIRDVFKFIIDKFVCHQDNVTLEDIGLCNAWMADLNNPYFENNLRHIVNEISNIIDNAPKLSYNQ